MIDNLLRIVFGDVNNSSSPNRQEEAVPDIDKKTANNTDPEIKILEDKFGNMKRGLEIEISLQDILQLIPRQRQKTDAYNGLVKRLKAEYEVCLKITSRKTKKI